MTLFPGEGVASQLCLGSYDGGGGVCVSLTETDGSRATRFTRGSSLQNAVRREQVELLKYRSQVAAINLTCASLDQAKWEESQFVSIHRTSDTGMNVLCHYFWASRDKQGRAALCLPQSVLSSKAGKVRLWWSICKYFALFCQSQK